MGKLTPGEIAELDQQTALLNEHLDLLLEAVMIRLATPKDEEDIRNELADSAISIIKNIYPDFESMSLMIMTMAARMSILMCNHYEMHSMDLSHEISIHHKNMYDIIEKFNEIQARGQKGCGIDTRTPPGTDGSTL